MTSQLIFAHQCLSRSRRISMTLQHTQSLFLFFENAISRARITFQSFRDAFWDDLFTRKKFTENSRPFTEPWLHSSPTKSRQKRKMLHIRMAGYKGQWITRGVFFFFVIWGNWPLNILENIFHYSSLKQKVRRTLRTSVLTQTHTHRQDARSKRSKVRKRISSQWCRYAA